MTFSIILVKLTGAAILGWNIWSMYKQKKQNDLKAAKEKKQADGENQSRTEYALNLFLLYLWRAFIFVFSIGMIVNN